MSAPLSTLLDIFKLNAWKSERRSQIRITEVFYVETNIVIKMLQMAFHAFIFQL